MSHEQAPQQPQFGEPNQAQQGQIESGLYAEQLTGLSGMYEHPTSKSLFQGAEFSLALYATAEDEGATGVVRRINIPAREVEVGGLENPTKASLSADIEQGFLFSKDEQGNPIKAKRTVITLRSPGSTIPLLGEGSDTADAKATEANIVLLDGKVSTVSWKTPEKPAEGISQIQMNPKFKPEPSFKLVSIPELAEHRRENGGEIPHGDKPIDKRVETILAAAKEVFDTTQEGNEKEKSRRTEAAENLARSFTDLNPNALIEKIGPASQEAMPPDPFGEPVDSDPLRKYKAPL